MKFLPAVVLAPVLAASVAFSAPGAAEAVTAGQPDATGTYTVSRTSAYLMPDDDREEFFADFKVTETSSTNSLVARRSINPGDGSVEEAWTSGTTITLRYTQPGTFTPVVTLVDREGDVTTVRLTPVKVVSDTIKPRMTITRPRKAAKVGAWKVARGTTTDVGTGVSFMFVYVLEKRGKIWWLYDFSTRTWIKGYPSATMTENRVVAMPFIVPGPIKAWTTPTIRGMKKGVVRVHALAVDYNENYGEAILTQKVK